MKRSFIRTFPRTYEAAVLLTGLTPKGRAQGVDIYGKYQGWFRPETAKQVIHFAIQKLTEGTTISDPKIDEIWEGVRKIGIRGAYHYQRSGISWLAQANYFLSVASKYDHHFYALDVEKINNTLDDVFAADMFRILKHWKSQTSKKVVLYSNKDVFETFIYPAIKKLYGDLGVKWLTEEIDIWYSQYWNVPSFDKDPALPAWMKTWKVYQITDSYYDGWEWGVQSLDVDVNVYNGTPDEMRAWLGIDSDPAPQPEPPKEETMQYKYNTLTNERTSMLTTIANLTGKQYQVGEVVTVLEIFDVGADKWFKLGPSQYSVYIYGGVTRAFPVTPPPPVPAAVLDLVIESTETRYVVRDNATGKRYGAVVSDAPNVEFVEL